MGLLNASGIVIRMLFGLFLCGYCGWLLQHGGPLAEVLLIFGVGLLLVRGDGGGK
jgi:hypothetical protein